LVQVAKLDGHYTQVLLTKEYPDKHDDKDVTNGHPAAFVSAQV